MSGLLGVSPNLRTGKLGAAGNHSVINFYNKVTTASATAVNSNTAVKIDEIAVVPVSTSSKFWILTWASIDISAGSTGLVNITLKQGGNNIYSSGSFINSEGHHAGHDGQSGLSCWAVHSPGSTSSITYELWYGRTSSSTSGANFYSTGSDHRGTLTILEFAG